MNRLKSNVQYFKTIMEQGSELILLRLRLLLIDVTSQLGGSLKIIGIFFFASAIFLFGSVSLLFALNSIISTEIKFWVFGGIFLLSLIVVLIMLMAANATWKKRSQLLINTVNDLQQDIIFLKKLGQNDGKGNNHDA